MIVSTRICNCPDCVYVLYGDNRELQVSTIEFILENVKGINNISD